MPVGHPTLVGACVVFCQASDLQPHPNLLSIRHDHLLSVLTKELVLKEKETFRDYAHTETYSEDGVVSQLTWFSANRDCILR